MKIRLVLMAIAIVILLQASGLKSEECSEKHLAPSEVVRGDAEAYPNVQKP